ncbi:uncharacterized protein PHACADRAFT_202378 [Phanerochaete carnosa HHB-10118-sp]|uniref:Uncharacterized protein n=1 Tax=Phanerochaete carnosa (strain HHB-10118-sp) TaxID=650164 RepID=K5VQG9_PHACS|nr:uncharacterized protein PHACADRAFT_202378 [Phanerochaete carnosa HHB-10118-sp]EKM48799.1 hypothetical protein PHACADRAFT_202378 [Phanerochaete carnosa HHB-10118-sp]
MQTAAPAAVVASPPPTPAAPVVVPVPAVAALAAQPAQGAFIVIPPPPAAPALPAPTYLPPIVQVLAGLPNPPYNIILPPIVAHQPPVVAHQPPVVAHQPLIAANQPATTQNPKMRLDFVMIIPVSTRIPSSPFIPFLGYATMVCREIAISSYNHLAKSYRDIHRLDLLSGKIIVISSQQPARGVRREAVLQGPSVRH